MSCNRTLFTFLQVKIQTRYEICKNCGAEIYIPTSKDSNLPADEDEADRNLIYIPTSKDSNTK